MGISARFPDVPSVSETGKRPPTLYLSVAGDFRQAVHFRQVQDPDNAWLRSSFVAPLHVLPVAPYRVVEYVYEFPTGLASFHAGENPPISAAGAVLRANHDRLHRSRHRKQ